MSDQAKSIIEESEQECCIENSNHIDEICEPVSPVKDDLYGFDSDEPKLLNVFDSLSENSDKLLEEVLICEEKDLDTLEEEPKKIQFNQTIFYIDPKTKEQQEVNLYFDPAILDEVKEENKQMYPIFKFGSYDNLVTLVNRILFKIIFYGLVYASIWNLFLFFLR